jgi:hypothetical protein
MHQQQLQLWRSWAAGEIDDDDAQAAAEAVHAWKRAGQGRPARPQNAPAGFSESWRGIRATRRAADWRRDLARGLEYALGQTPEQAEELIAEYERREQEGLDFLRIRPESTFAEAPVINLDRNARIRLAAKFRAVARRSWQLKQPGRHRGIITRTAAEVFLALLYLAEKYHRVFPSLEGLRHLAMCCRQSVVTALADLERLGFITRIRRIRRVMTPLGFTTRQITNAYDVHEPRSGLGLLAMGLFTTESSIWTPSAAKFLFNYKRPDGFAAADSTASNRMAMPHGRLGDTQ